MNATVSTSKRSSSVPWERVWQSQPTAVKDDVLLSRERSSKRWSLIVERIVRAFGSIRGLTTVELGSGRGDLSALLAERGATVTLVDSCETALDQARVRFDRLGLSATYRRADFLDAAFADGQRHDVSLSSGVIEHFKNEDRTRTVRAHFDVLAPGGMTVISVPHAHCPTYRLWKLYLELRGWWPYGMEIPYTKRELDRRTRDAGFARVEAHCTGLLQSIGTHWFQRVLGRRPGWTDRTCPLDSMLGFTLLVFGWRGDAKSDVECRKHSAGSAVNDG